MTPDNNYFTPDLIDPFGVLMRTILTSIQIRQQTLPVGRLRGRG